MQNKSFYLLYISGVIQGEKPRKMQHKRSFLKEIAKKQNKYGLSSRLSCFEAYFQERVFTDKKCYFGYRKDLRVYLKNLPTLFDCNPQHSYQLNKPEMHNKYQSTFLLNIQTECCNGLKEILNVDLLSHLLIL